MLRYRTRDILPHPTPSHALADATIVGSRRSAPVRTTCSFIRGVNVFPSQIEAGLMSIDSVLPHYLIVVDRDGDLDTLEIKVEVTQETLSDDIKSLEALRARIAHAVQRIINISARITLVEPHTLPRSEGKIKRVNDLRKKS
jgi:phenylacetate-CoA ligase